jgi:hypothetical protein
MAEVVVIYDGDNVIVNVSECDCGSGGSDVSLFQFTGSNTTSYTDASLIGKTILLVFIDAQKISTTAFVFTIGTGNINFGSVIDTGAEIDILYK